MSGWDWLTKQTYPWRFVRHVVIKAAVLFILVNAAYAATDPLPSLSQVTFYNLVFPGRERLPYADNPSDVYNISLQRIEGMFAAHKLSSTHKTKDEYRVVILGDSGVWGWLLETNQTLSACLNQGNYQTSDGQTLRVYNLGYPVTSVMKDALILQEALRYDLDGVVWMTTLQALYNDEQLRHPIMQNNPDRAREFIESYDLPLDVETLPNEGDFWDRTIIGQRRELADLLRHQIYGLAWMITGFDHTNPRFFEARVDNLPNSEGVPSRGYIQVGDDLAQYLSFEVINATIQMADVPVLIVNEPIFRAEGINSDLRYNDLYPRWAYDQYRTLINEQATQNNWHYLDVWDAVPNDQFTDYPLHYTPSATCEFAAQLAPHVLALVQ